MFKIDGKNKFISSKDEFSGVKKIAEKVCLDVERVTDVKPVLLDNDSEAASGSIIFGTLGKASFLESLVEASEVDKIRGKRESYLFHVTSDKLIIVGSDKRGTIYGLFHISELMGVSPLVDWNGILPAKHPFVEIEEGITVSKEPSVKFRGFFINDEWPAFGNFANHNFGGLNAKMYEHVFELLLRLKGNYLWPAMWASRFSDDGPGLLNAELADELGVIMGASHHEPCCRAGEEYKHLRGPDSIYGDAWNFRTNEKGITKFWEDGLKRNGKFENVITVGMRGEADTAIMKNATLADNINLLRDVIKTQNRLIRENVNEDLMKVPRMLALYKEVEPYFYGDKHTKGLMDDPELEGVTLMLCEDNHGNLRTVPNEAMRSHKGGYGMYYHFDYHGWPFSFEWFNTSYLPKVKEQMSAAYEFGVRELWIVNMGDILTNEFPLSYFLDLAYDFDTFSKIDFTTAEYTRKWTAFQFNYFNDEQKAEVADILINATKISNMRRTECIQPDTFHPENFGEGNKMISAAKDLIARTEALLKLVPEEQKAGFYSQVYLPVCGNMNVLLMQLYSGKNRFFAERNALVANIYADKMKECYAYDKMIVDACDKVADGKFFGMGWSEHFGFRNWCEANNHYPVYMYVEGTRKKRAVVWIDGSELYTSGQDWTLRDLKLTAFRNPEITEAYVKIASCNEGGLELKTSTECEWLSFTIENDVEKLTSDGKSGLDTIVLKIDREKLAKACDKKALLKIEGNDGHGARILVNIHVDAEVPDCNFPSGSFVQTEKYISMEAPHFVRSSGFAILDGYGKTLGAVKASDVTASFAAGDEKAPFVEYAFAMDEKFIEETSGLMAFDFYLNPSNPAYKDNKLEFVAEINNQKLLKEVVDSEKFAVGDEQQPWGTDITNNIRVSTVYAECKAGLNSLKVRPVTPNIVLEKIVIHEANKSFPKSYLGAPETFRIK
ncbi:MAG: glycosyl hydrolase 115 family protein [Treponema sp.]|nr:glycosyl hydrolase 115 family protein [Treponema sp.]